MPRSAVSSVLLKRLAAGPLKIAKAWEEASPRLRAFRPDPESWTLAEVVIHLLDVELALGWRLRHIVGDREPRIVPFDQDAWATELHYSEQDPSAALSAYAALRLCHVDLARRLSAEQLAKTGQHPERGPISAAWILERFAQHDVAHLEQAARNRTAFAKLSRVEPKVRRPRTK